MGNELKINDEVKRHYPSLMTRASDKVGKVLQVWRKGGVTLYLVAFPGCVREWYRDERLKKVE